jgi:hypothetical protein
MKRLFAVLALLVMVSNVVGDVPVRGYYRNDGTYVAPHYRSDPDGDFYNNWSTYPNVNPYTGEIGTRRTPPSSYPGGYYYDYGSGRSHKDDGGALSWGRILLVIGAIALSSSAFIKKDEERKPS